MKSLKAKMLISIIVVSAAGLLAVALSGYLIARRSIIEDGNKIALAKTEQLSMHADEEFDKWKSVVEMLASTNTSMNMDFEAFSKYVNDRKDVFCKDFDSFLISDTTGNTLTTTGSEVNIADRDYFAGAMEGRTVIFEPIVSRATNEAVFTIASPIKNEEETMVNVCKNMIAGKTGWESYIFQGVKKVTAYAPIGTEGWSIAVTIDESDLLKNLVSLRNNIIMFTLITLFALFTAIWLISNSITKPIAGLTSIIERLSDYDLSIDDNSKVIKYKDRKDEIGIIARAIITMQEKLLDLVKEISDISQQVASSSEELTAISQQSATTANEVAVTIEDIARGASNQAHNTEEGAVHISELGKLIENLSAISEENAAGTQEASASIEEQTSSMEEIANASESLAKLAEEMQESMNRFKY